MSKVVSAIYASTIAFALIGGAATAATTTASSSAYGASANLTALGTVSAVAAVGPVSGTAPAAYDRTTTVASANNMLTLFSTGIFQGFQSLKTGLVTDKASSTWPLTLAATASSTVNDLSTGLSSSVLGGFPTLGLGLAAGTITSTTSVGVGSGGLTGSGSARIEGLQVTGGLLGALNIDGALFVNPDPNTVLLNLVGLSVTLNEQKQTLAGLTGILRETNAIHIALNNYLLAGSIVTGDIIIGHSQASVANYVPGAAGAVPEPASWGLMIVGFGLVGAAVRRKRAVVAA